MGSCWGWGSSSRPGFPQTLHPGLEGNNSLTPKLWWLQVKGSACTNTQLSHHSWECPAVRTAWAALLLTLTGVSSLHISVINWTEFPFLVDFSSHFVAGDGWDSSRFSGACQRCWIQVWIFAELHVLCMTVSHFPLHRAAVLLVWKS